MQASDQDDEHDESLASDSAPLFGQPQMEMAVTAGNEDDELPKKNRLAFALALTFVVGIAIAIFLL